MLNELFRKHNKTGLTDRTSGIAVVVAHGERTKTLRSFSHNKAMDQWLKEFCDHSGLMTHDEQHCSDARINITCVRLFAFLLNSARKNK